MQLLAHLFIPRETNNYHAKVLQPSFLFFVAALFLLFYITRIPFHTAQILGYTANVLPAEKIVELTNKKRTDAGLSPLRFSATLAQAAREKGADMLSRDYWAHFAPNGVSPWSFFTKVGYRYQYAGENLARDFSNPESVVAAWIASPTHRENLLSGKYEDIGVAVVEGDLSGIPTTIVVQFLGTKTGSGIASLPYERFEVPTTTIAPEKPSVAPTQLGKIRSVVSSFPIERNIALALLGLLMLVLLVDAAVVFQKRLVRISGRSLAHFSFLASIGFLILISQRGSIL